ncbi:short-chain dehydrogenase/reductase SDR [Dactylonectria macrodidyma]|uniref:Short-chain dehydrogenase/reductase SDR n=1 Tax=Dactylonectria macrodidyma TaxID=307937 RepID=A0A9P9FQF0_9HYPO|nr:short-chain dehydrogenase/reductase SDR [Dactylonectria macrodidyma]
MAFSKDELKLNGGIAVITGAGGGIGSGLARRAGQLGMTVIVADIAIDKAEEVTSDIRSTGGKAEAIAVDVSRPEELDRLADYTFTNYGTVRLLVNNAGIETLGFCWEIPAARWESTLNINIHGVVHGVRAFAPRMLAAKEECWIANLSSAGAFGMIPTQAAYIMTKHAVQSFSEGLFLDMKLIGAPIHVCSVIPGLMRTGIFRNGSGAPDADPDRSQLRAYQKAMSEMARDYGMDIKQGSEIIMRKVAAGEFWVTTHPETTARIVAGRIEFLTKESNPEIMPGSKHLLDF